MSDYIGNTHIIETNLKELNIDLKNKNGEYKFLSNIMIEIKRKFEEMDEEQKQKTENFFKKK